MKLGGILASRELGLSVLALATLVLGSSLHLLAGVVSTLLTPLPVFTLRVTGGRRLCLAVAAGILSLYGLLHGGKVSPAVLLHIGALMLVGFFLAECVLAGCFIGASIAVSSGASLCVLLIPCLLWPGPEGSSLWEAFRSQVLANLEVTTNAYHQLGGISQEELPEFKESLETFARRLFYVFPALVTMGIALSSWFTLLAARKIGFLKDLFSGPWQALREWRAPDPMVYILIVSGFALLVPIPGLKRIGLNVLLPVLLVYFFQGLAVVAFVFHRKRVPVVLRGFLYAFIGLHQMATVLVAGLGLMEIWLNFRKPGKAAADAE